MNQVEPELSKLIFLYNIIIPGLGAATVEGLLRRRNQHNAGWQQADGRRNRIPVARPQY
jgi:hypothetical protein